MSATSGMRIWRLISPSFSAASRTGTAQRTMSQPAVSSAQISSSVACTSRVSVFVIDWTVSGASPPTFTLPTWICRVFRREIMTLLLLEELEGVDTHEIIVERVDHQHHQQYKSELLRGLALLQRQRAPQDALDDEEKQVSAVQHRHGEQIEHRQIDADDRREHGERPQAFLRLLSRHGRDLDGAADVRAVDRTEQQLPQPLH